MARTRSPGPSVSSSAQGCFMPWSICMAWRSSMATSRGERGGLGPAQGWATGMRCCPLLGPIPLPLSLFSFTFSPFLASLGALLSLLYPRTSVFLGCTLSLIAVSMNCLSPRLSFPNKSISPQSLSVFPQQALHSPAVFHFPSSSWSGSGP